MLDHPPHRHGGAITTGVHGRGHGTGPGPVGAAHADAFEEERPLAAVAYLFTWLTGLIIFLVAKKEQRYARWHALQAIGFGVVAMVLSMLVNMLASLLVWGGAPPLPVFQSGPLAALLSLGMLVWIVALGFIVVLAVSAYQGKSLRLPVLAGLADKHA